MDSVKIGKIKQSDNKKAGEFCLGIFEEMGWDKGVMYDFSDLNGEYCGKRDVFFLAKDGEKIVGSGGLKELSEKDVLMKMFYMDKNQRGTGLASKIFGKIKDFAVKKGYQNIVLNLFKTNDRARKFYEKQGFVIFNPGVVDNWEHTKTPELFEFRILKLK